MALRITEGLDAFNETYELLRSNLKDLLVKFLILDIITWVIVLVMLGILAGLAFLLIGNALLDMSNARYVNNLAADLMANMVPLLGGGLLLFVIVSVINGALSAIKFRYVEAKTEKSIFQHVSELIIPVGRYTFLMWAIMAAILAIPTGFAVYLMLNANGFGLVVLPLFMLDLLLFLIFAIIGIVIAFFIQFSLLEVVLNNSGVVKSFYRSIDLVKNNPMAALMFDLVLGVILVIVSIPFAIIREILSLGFGFMNLIIGGGLVNNLATVVVSHAADAVVGGMGSLVISLIFIPAQYFFWKKLSR